MRDVLQQELRALARRHDVGRPAGGNISGLLENPRVAQRATADEHA